MTTVQESPNGHHSFPPPCSLPGSQDENRSKDSTGDNSNSIATNDQVVERQKGVPITPHLAQEKVPFPASAYHVPPGLYAPKADSFRDTIPNGLSAMKLPERCQFMFSDGRQCTMARSDIHPSLCTYHADREEQLFGDPSHGFVTRKFDFPELFSASRDLTTAAGVNRALGQVFRLLAQRRISRQEAATFGQLAKLLLRTIALMAAEAEVQREIPSTTWPQVQASLSAPPTSKLETDDPIRIVVPSEQREPRDLSFAAEARTGDHPSASSFGINTYEIDDPVRSSGESRLQDELSPVSKVVPSETGVPDTRCLCARWGGEQRESSDLSPHICTPHARNPHRMNTSEIAEFKPVQNEHLQEVRRERPRVKVFFAANVIPWNELRGANNVIRSFRAVKKSIRSFAALTKSAAFVAQVARPLPPERVHRSA